MEDRRGQNDEMSREIQETIETEAEKTGMAEAEGREKERRSRKKKGRKREKNKKGREKKR